MESFLYTAVTRAVDQSDGMVPVLEDCWKSRELLLKVGSDATASDVSSPVGLAISLNNSSTI